MSSLYIQPSPPPSPTEGDIGRAGVYADSEAGASTATLTGITERQRQKRRAEGTSEDDNSSTSSDEASDRKESYPPTNDDKTESRRVEENLRKWEVAERERRRAARDSSSTATSTSLVGDVTRKASLLWPGRRRSRQAAQGVGTHHVIPTSEEGVAMDDIENDTPTPHIPEAQNPFITPMSSTVSLNTPQDSAIMMESSDSTAKAAEQGAKAQHGLGRRNTRSHPPPQPLDIPEPRTPPPRTGTPHANRPPEPIAPPSVSEIAQEEELPEKRWWTDWLCGCREHGDNQAGRTNPFE